MALCRTFVSRLNTLYQKERVGATPGSTSTAGRQEEGQFVRLFTSDKRLRVLNRAKQHFRTSLPDCRFLTRLLPILASLIRLELLNSLLLLTLSQFSQRMLYPFHSELRLEIAGICQTECSERGRF